MKTKLQSKPVNSNRYTVQYHEQHSPEHHEMTCITQGKPMKYSSTLSFKNNHVTTSSTISWTRIAHLQDFLVNLLPRVQAIDCCFYFPTHLFLHLLYLGKLSMKQNHERFAKTCDSDKKTISVKAVRRRKTVEWIARQRSETWKHQQSAEENPQNGYKWPATRQR